MLKIDIEPVKHQDEPANLSVTMSATYWYRLCDLETTNQFHGENSKRTLNKTPDYWRGFMKYAFVLSYKGFYRVIWIMFVHTWHVPLKVWPLLHSYRWCQLQCCPYIMERLILSRWFRQSSRCSINDGTEHCENNSVTYTRPSSLILREDCDNNLSPRHTI